MYRSALRSSPRAVAALRQTTLSTTVRRFASTTPASKKRSWKSSAVRIGLVVGAVYWYNTSPIFADELQPQHVTPPPQFSDDDLPTVEAVVENKRKEAEARLAKVKESREAKGEAVSDHTTQATDSSKAPPSETEVPATQDAETAALKPSGGSSPEDLEAEAGQQGAFNPETGEINWACPCLGGMADGPCGEEFKAAFSCFVYSTEEPKGMDCIDKFQHMQDCFRKHPEVYGDELADEEEEAAGEGGIPEAGTASASTATNETDAAPPTTPTSSTPSPPATANASINVKPEAADAALPANSADGLATEASEQK